MKKAICILLAAATLVLCACGGTSAEEQPTTVTPAQTTAPTQTPAPEPTVSPKPDKNGFDEATNTEYVLGGISFQIPSYYGEPEPNGDGELIKAQEGESSVGGIQFLEGDIDAGLSDDVFRETEKEIIDTLAENLKAKSGEIEDITLCGIAAARAEISYGKNIACLIVYPNKEKKSISMILAAYSPDTEFDYMPDFDRILASAELVEEDEPDGVTPEFKAQMDSYEAFFNEYVEFMQNYLNSGDVAGMLMKYASMMSKYSEMMEALDSIDESQLSTADYAYYLEVTARITQNLAKILG